MLLFFVFIIIFVCLWYFYHLWGLIIYVIIFCIYYHLRLSMIFLSSLYLQTFSNAVMKNNNFSSVPFFLRFLWNPFRSRISLFFISRDLVKAESLLRDYLCFLLMIGKTCVNNYDLWKFSSVVALSLKCSFPQHFDVFCACLS